MQPISIAISKRLVGASNGRDLREKISSVISEIVGMKINQTNISIEENKITISVSGSKRAVLFLKKEEIASAIYKKIGTNKEIR